MAKKARQCTVYVRWRQQNKPEIENGKPLTKSNSQFDEEILQLSTRSKPKVRGNDDSREEEEEEEDSER